MSTSFPFHGSGLQGYEYVRLSFVAGSIIFWIKPKPKPKLVRCLLCKSLHVIRRGSAERWLRAVPIGFKPVWLAIRVPRVEYRKSTRPVRARGTST